MSAPAPRGDMSQAARLALLGIGTIATGAFGLLGLAAGYKLKQMTAADPEKVTPQTYLNDLTHLIPPWKHTDGEDGDTNGGTIEADMAGVYSSTNVGSGGMDSRGYRRAEQESKHPGDGASSRWRRQSSDTSLADELKRKSEIDAWESMNEKEELELTFKYDPAMFSPEVASHIPLPLGAKSLCHVLAFLPVESIANLSGTCHTLHTFSETLLSHRGFLYRIARSHQGFNEFMRGAIWMRISGAQKIAAKMGTTASATTKENFYEHQLARSIEYRDTIVKQNASGGLRTPQTPGATPRAVTPIPVDAYLIDGLSVDGRAAMDTILKDVPRTLVPSNPASRSLISNGNSADLDQVEGSTSHLVVPSASPSSSSSSSSSSSVSRPSRLILENNMQATIVSLSNVLSVYSLHDRELGYCQGMNFIAAFFLSKLPEQDAYWLFYTVMNDRRWSLRSFYMNDLRGLLLCKYTFNFFFQLYLPELYAHFQQQDIHSDIFTEMFMTFFTYASFPRRYPLLERIWDLILLTGGIKYLYRITLSILYLSQTQLLSYEFEEIIGYWRNFPDEGILNPDIILPIACDFFKISNAALEEIEKRYDVEMDQQQQIKTKENQQRLEKKRKAEEKQQQKDDAASVSAASEEEVATIDNLQPPTIISISPPASVEDEKKSNNLSQQAH